MKRTAIITLSAATLALSACGHKQAQTDTATNTASSDTGSSNVANGVSTKVSAGQTFANDAAASDAFEVATSRLALASATSPSIKKFAQKMIDAHTSSTAKLKESAASASPAITPDPTLTAEQQTKLDGLKTLSGQAFDKAYATAQVDGHKMTLETLRAYSASGDVPELKTFATTVTPTVAAHLNMAKTL